LLQKIKSILFRKSLQQVGVYTVTGSLCKAISFAALPFFVNMLSEGDIGILNIYSNCIVFLTPIVSMGVLYTIAIDYFKLPRAEYARIFSTGLLIPVTLSILLIPVLYLLRIPLEKAFNFQPDFIWLIPIGLILNFCFEAFIILIRNQNKVKLFAIVSLLKVLIEVSLSVLFIVWLWHSWYSRALAFVTAGIAISTMFIYHIQKQGFLVPVIDRKVLRNEVVFGLSGMALQTAIFFINTSDKFFVMSFFGKNQAGYYAVASTFATVQYIVCMSLMQYLQPILFSRFADGKKWKYVKGLFYKYILVMIATLLAVTVFTITVYSFLLKSAYKPYLHYFYILSIASFLWTIAYLFLQYIVFHKNKKILFQLAAISIAVAISINYIGSSIFNMNWLAGGQIVINIIVVSIVLLFNKKLGFFA
jgi:O-antigen/teichoic acid export membrane protein